MGVKKHSKTNPRSVRGAEKRGWHVLSPKNYHDKGVSWVGLMIWSDRMLSGHYVQDFQTHRFAFEKSEDASYFAMKWCL